MDNKEERRIDREIHDQNTGSDPFAAAMRATRMPMLITDPRQPDNPIVFVNDAFARLTGYSRDETLGRNCRFLQGPGTNLDDVAKVRKAIADREPIEIDLLNYKKDGTLFWNRLLVSPVFNDGELSYYFASQLDVTRERTAGISPDRDEVEASMEQRIADLTASEDRLQFTLKAGGLGTWTLELPQQRLVASPICKANFGRAAADTFTYDDLAASIHPDDRARWAETVQQALANGGDLHVDYRAIWPDGSQHWIEIRAQTRYDASGNPMLMSGVSIDITEAKEADEYRTLMTHEMGHRIKNILATVQSVVSQSLRADEPIESIRTTVVDRINALGRSQDILTGAKADVAGIRDSVAMAIEPFNQAGRIHFFGPEIKIGQDASGALMMALHELATNAVKYGALSNDGGRILIEWGREGDDLVFRWTESGGPEVQKPSRSGFGSRMIERALSATIRGEATIDFRSVGIVFTMRAPIENFG
ncbi:PAS domain S-box-containing protein [Devosia lucknowensis]|uniref:Blue-light-activated histidine kinase n=1 Tax=Devosia lucknowensis TaxID=1096929 RepID=A0A1Y6GBR3_9HYPH|nr:PAS domain-containing protein [Devosia lucknowensis]SMQ85499.1 PAS domain S-box-containing protein [Devosia lucknowensis]